TGKGRARPPSRRTSIRGIVDTTEPYATVLPDATSSPRGRERSPRTIQKAPPPEATLSEAPAEPSPAPESGIAVVGATAIEHPAPSPPGPQGAPPATPTSKMSKKASPGAPMNLTVDDVNDNSVTLTWDAPEIVGSSGVDGYMVEYCKDGTIDWVTANTKPFLSTRYIIGNLTSGDKLHIRVKAVKGDGVSDPAVLDQPLLIREVLEHPKIRLPRYLRELYMRTVGDVVNLMIPFWGKPKPQVTWTKEGQPLDLKRVNVRNSERDSIFFIREAQRKDSGKYEITVKILDELEDKATVDLQVIERPGPPENLKLVDVWGFNVALEWSPPRDNGNADLKGYTVQKADMKTGQWFTVLEHYNHTSCTVSDLIIGNSYSFRVFSENPCGLSEKPAVTKDVAHIKKSAIMHKSEKVNSRDLSEPPKFTQPLTDRTTTRGYSTQLVCCVRGFPMPKVIWMKNQMEIREDPKYLALMNQGVCSLEIRKPSPFDGGVYTCKAVNPLGEASVDCRLNVKVPE
ncbi:myosin-binding protein H, partial [Rhineura floridana]|uniref:myosin-binding protein H n=1 Tax=Rhineura floridana TaxID=261503 RepID=UPI002AC7FC4F